VAHVVLLQHVLDMEALSAGIWYVAIDFQLYAMTLLSVLALKFWPQRWGAPSAHALRRALWLGLTCASWWWWNLHTGLDDHGVYFFGSYGLGLLAWEARQLVHRPLPQTDSQAKAHVPLWVIWVIFLTVGAVAWGLGPRLRMGLAFAVAAVLMAAPASILSGQALQTLSGRRSGWAWFGRAVVWLSTVSYSVFLIHFGVSLALSAWVTALWPGVLWANALGMLASLALSLLVGAGLHYGVERHAPTWRRWSMWALVFTASAALAMP
jgi:peptidoglycan/LPS O-acetylase OafA/YrhL